MTGQPLQEAIDQRPSTFGLAKIICDYRGLRVRVSSISDGVATCWPADRQTPNHEPIEVPVGEITLTEPWPSHGVSRS